MAAISFPLAITLRAAGGSPGLDTFFPVMTYGTPLFVAVSFMAYLLTGAARGIWHHASIPDLLVIFKSATLAILLFLPALFAIDRLDSIPRSVPFTQWCLLIVMLSGSRLIYATLVGRWASNPRAHSFGQWEPILIVGAGRAAALLIQLLRDGPSSRFEAVGIVDDQARLRGRTIHQVPVLGRIADIDGVIARLWVHGVRPTRIVVAIQDPKARREAFERLDEVARQRNCVVQGLFEILQSDTDADRAASSTPLVEAEQVSVSRTTSLKRIIDVAVAAGMLAACAPIIAVVAIGVWLTLGRPILFRQIRPGRGMRPFRLYKFRTLRDGYQSDGSILDDEQRQTPFGRLLRRTRLDELPQLWNVLIGDMSLIGPRPLLLRDLPTLGDVKHERFLVRPGLTGWAQVNGGKLIPMQDKMDLDLWYIRNMCIRLDLKIIVKTIMVMVAGDRVLVDGRVA